MASEERKKMEQEIEQIGAKHLESYSEIGHLDDQYKRLQTILSAKE